MNAPDCLQPCTAWYKLIHMKLSGRNAFSLVELSIVLVILGLLTGGILAGQSLIHAAEMRSISTDINRYTTALRTFQDKYFALPGDMTNATAFWGAQDSGDGLGADCTGVDSTTPLTCNGNGSGNIYADNSGATDAPEAYRAWQHLANAGLIEGSYRGKQTSGSLSITPGQNIPASKIGAGIGWFWNYRGFENGTSGYFNGNYGQMIRLGSGQAARTAVISAQDMWNLDTKMDDGRPAYGVMRGNKSDTFPECTTATAVTADYKLDSTSSTGCSVQFIVQPM